MANKIQLVIQGKNLASPVLKKVTIDLDSLKKTSDLTNSSFGSSSRASNNFTNSLKNIKSNSLNQVNFAARALASTLTSIAKIGIGGVFATAAASVMTLKTALTKAMDMEIVTTTFSVLLGDIDKANTMILKLRDFAAKTPLQLQPLTDLTAQLLGAGSKESAIIGELQMLGDLAMGNSEKMNRLTDAYAKLQTKGKASLEEINRFTEAGVPVLKELSKQYSISQEELMKLISQGKVGFPEVQQALKALTSEGGQFAGMMGKQATTLAGKWSTFKDSITENLISIGQKFLPDVKKALDNLQTATDALFKSEGFQSLVTATVKIISYVLQKIPSIILITEFLGEVVKITSDELSKLFTKMKNAPVIGATFKVFGATFDALKKGFLTGDWSDLFELSDDIIKEGLKIAIAFIGIKSAISVLTTTIFSGLLGAGFTKGIGAGRALAVLSIGIEIYNTLKGEQEWEVFGAKLIAALAAGIGIGSFFKSPKAGYLAFAISMSLDFSSVWSTLDNFAQQLKEKFKPKEDFGVPLVKQVVNTVTGNTQATSPMVYNKSQTNLSIAEKYSSLGISEDFVKNIREAIPKEMYSLGGIFTKIFGKDLFSDEKKLSKISGTDVGKMFFEGLDIGLSEIGDLAEGKANLFVQLFRDIWGIHSPSKVATNLANFWTRGVFVGLDGLKTVATDKAKDFSKNFEDNMTFNFGGANSDLSYFERLKQAYDELIKKLEALKTAGSSGDVAKILADMGIGAKLPSGGSGAKVSDPSFWEKLGDAIRGGSQSAIGAKDAEGKAIPFGTKILNLLIEFISKIESVVAIMDPLRVVFEGIFKIVTPMINSILRPVLGFLDIIGQTIGKMLLPILEALMPVVEKIMEGFIFLYNNVILPIANGLITVFNFVANGIIGIVNSVIWALNLLPFVDIDYIRYRSLDQGHLSKIDMGDLNQAGEDYAPGGSSNVGSSTSSQSYNIRIYQTIEGNVIGDGGMAQLGKYLVEAISAYAGAGGKIEFIEAVI